jgi:hypothetical protein
MMEIPLNEMIVGHVYCDTDQDESNSTYLKYVGEDDVAYWFKEVGGQLDFYVKPDGFVGFGKRGVVPFAVTPKCAEFSTETA